MWSGRSGALGSARSAPAPRRRCARPPARCRPQATTRPGPGGHDPAHAPWGQLRQPKSRSAGAAGLGCRRANPGDRRPPGAPVRLGCSPGRRRRGGGCAGATPAATPGCATSGRAGANGRPCRTGRPGEHSGHPPRARPDRPTSAGKAWLGPPVLGPPLLGPPLLGLPALAQPDFEVLTPASWVGRSAAGASGATALPGASKSGRAAASRVDGSPPRDAPGPPPLPHPVGRTARGAAGPSRRDRAPDALTTHSLATVTESFQSWPPDLPRAPGQFGWPASPP